MSRQLSVAGSEFTPSAEMNKSEPSLQSLGTMGEASYEGIPN